MSEQLLRQAIRRDFPAAASRLSRTTHPREKTTVLTFVVEDLLPDAGPARISYITTWAGSGRFRRLFKGLADSGPVM